jgi:hypothetical protein
MIKVNINAFTNSVFLNDRLRSVKSYWYVVLKQNKNKTYFGLITFFIYSFNVVIICNDYLQN